MRVERVVDSAERLGECPLWDERATCCCFGGAQLDTLYITTADGAGIFAVKGSMTGLPEERFSG